MLPNRKQKKRKTRMNNSNELLFAEVSGSYSPIKNTK